jgi:polyhydroxyalkanoate synthesis regulator phasin
MTQRSLSVLLVSAALATALACGKQEKPGAGTTAGGGVAGGPTPVANPELESARQENAALMENLGQTTHILTQVQEQLDALAKTGEVVKTTAQQLESGVKTKEQGHILFENIERARKLLDERAQKIKALEARVTGSEKELKQMVDLIGKLMTERAAEVARLEGEITKLTGEKRAVEAERDAERAAKEEEIGKRQEAETQLDTVYYAVGTEKELRAKGILAVKSGALGIKKRVSLAPVTSFEPFTKISAQKDQQIPLGKGVKKWEAASGHDLNKTNVEKRDDGEMFLDIHDPKTFWNEKVLVVVVTR